MNTFLSKTLLIFALTLSSFLARSESNAFEDVTILARIHSVKDVEAISGYAVSLEQEGLAQILTELKPEDEVLLKGRIRYRPVTADTKTEMRPEFIITKIAPVSLKRLGESEFQVAEPKIVFSLAEPRGPKTIPVSGKVASAITLTAAVLLMQNLSSEHSGKGPREKLQSEVFFGAGALATGTFIWEQLKSGSLK